MSTPPGTGDEADHSGTDPNTDGEGDRLDPAPRSAGGGESETRARRSSTRGGSGGSDGAFERKRSEAPSSEDASSREPASSTGDGETPDDRFAGSAAEWGVNDRAATEDRLDFGTYVAVLARFLANERTRPPLTVSIEGRWGTGKSSFMTLLRQSLDDDDRPSAGDDEGTADAAIGAASRPSFTVEFNPWRHEGEDALWAAFVLEFFQNVANPIETELRAYIDDPDYENRISFIEQFHEDFAEILDSYVGNEAHVYVFIDDLDRCPPPKAAELIQSINLMISSGDPRVFFVVGMDREKVAAGIAAKHGSHLPYLRAAEDRYSRRALQPDAARTDGANDRANEEARRPGEGAATESEAAGRTSPDAESIERFGLEFADDYLEKFVQIPFLIPKPGAAGIGSLVRELATAERDDGDSTGGESGSGRPTPIPSTTARAEADVLPSELIVEVATTVAPALEYNPRMVKTFVNLFRLRTMLATELGLFESGRLTPEQLGTFVAISLQWPRLVPQLRDPTAAVELYEFATGATEAVPPAIATWSPQERARLSTLLAAGVDEDRRPDQLARLPEELFWISPRVDTPIRSTDGAATAAR